MKIIPINWSTFGPEEAEKLKDELTDLWEASVRSSHHFLTEKDIRFFKPLVHNEYLHAVEIYAIRNAQNHIAAFMGLSGNLIEMLFVHPREQEKGYGRQLIEFAVCRKHIFCVDVNEQNEKALAFYRHRGFDIIGRDGTDSCGKPFPILHLALKEIPLQGTKETVEIRRILRDKKRYLDLLLLADEQETMVDRYLDRGEMFALYDRDILRTTAVITVEADRTIELKNMATVPSYQRKGYGSILLKFLFEHYSKDYDTLLVGTGDSPLTLPFYIQNGFRPSHRVKNFFTDNYNHPIYEGGKQLVDMIYLKIALNNSREVL